MFYSYWVVGLYLSYHRYHLDHNPLMNIHEAFQIADKEMDEKQ